MQMISSIRNGVIVGLSLLSTNAYAYAPSEVMSPLASGWLQIVMGFVVLILIWELIKRPKKSLLTAMIFVAGIGTCYGLIYIGSVFFSENVTAFVFIPLSIIAAFKIMGFAERLLDNENDSANTAANKGQDHE